MVAENFIQQDTVGANVLLGCCVQSAEIYGELWVVRLSPSGYVVISKDDEAEPIVAFSRRDFDAPSADSPFGTLLEIASQNVLPKRIRALAYSAQEVETNQIQRLPIADQRAKRWRALKSKERSLKFLPTLAFGKVNVSSSLVTQSPLLKTMWDQCQPFNDFCPIYSQENGKYRGRVPCGCVATAYAQILNYWQWPQRLVAPVENVHSVLGASMNELQLRLCAGEIFDYANMRSYYDNYNFSDYRYDLRGYMLERERLTIAKLILYADILAKMSFKPTGSSASLWAPCANDYYTIGRHLYRADLLATRFEDLRNSIVNGMPAMVGVPGHAIVGDGWAEDEEGNTYVHLNYGWGGRNDGYFTLNETDNSRAETGYILNVVVDHAPRKRPVLERLPAVCTSPVMVRWSLPTNYTGSATRGWVRAIGYRATPTDILDDFSTSSGTSSDPTRIYTGVFDYSGNQTAVLRFGTKSIGSYSYAQSYQLCSATRAYYRIRSYYALGMRVSLQIKLAGRNDWQDVDVPPLDEGYSWGRTWVERSVDLARFGGQVVSFRFLSTPIGSSYNDDGVPAYGVMVDDFRVENLFPEIVSSWETDLNDRAFLVEGLESGGLYRLEVLPEGGSASEPLEVRIAGRGRSLLPAENATSNILWSEWRDYAEQPLPEIRQITTFRADALHPVTEGLYRECVRGTNVFLVTCSALVTELEARASHVSLLPDNRIAVYPLGNARFMVVVDGSGLTTALDRTRMILTLKAKDQSGSEAIANLVLRFSAEGEIEEFIPPTPPSTTTDGTQTMGIKVPYAWFVENGLADEGASAEVMSSLAIADSDGDGFPNYQEYLCGTNPADADDKFTVYITLENGCPVISWNVTNAPLARYTVQGKTRLDTGEEWGETNRLDLSSGGFFRVKIEPAQE